MDLSAIDVQQKTFRERFRGYDPDDVEDFLDRVVETLRGQELKLQQQQEQLDGLSQDLAGTKEAEEAIKRTYITAQRTSQEMVNEASEKATTLLGEATRRRLW
jgi:cell division initiation protein